MTEGHHPDWQPSRLKFIADCNCGVLPEDTDKELSFIYVDIGNVTQGSMRLESSPIRFAEAPSRARRLAEPGDIVVSTVRTYLRAVATVPSPPDPEHRIVFSTGFAVLHPRPGIHPHWLAYYLQSDDFVDRVVAHSEGVSYPAIAASTLTSFGLLVPPHSEQRAIADFLDRETGQIDRLIGKQERLVETLRERRAAVVDNVLWKGLDGAERAATGIGPVPGAPKHWLRLRNKALLRERQEVSTDGSEELLTVSHLTGVTPRSEKDVNMFEAESLEGYRIVQSGDLVINTMWAWMGALGVSTYDGIVSPAYGVYQVVRPELFEKRFFGYLYRSQAYVTEMTRFSRGVWTSRLRLYPESFLRLWVVVPPLAEQRAVADYLDDQTAKIDRLIARAQRFIELAKERRAALITAAVTGRIDVRGAA